LVDPDNDYKAGGAVLNVIYRNPNTNEIAAVDNRSVATIGWNEIPDVSKIKYRGAQRILSEILS
jgi:hypothetical protein